MKNSNIFHISAQNIDCGYSLEPPRRGGSNESPQSMFLSRNKKNNVYPCKPQFYYIKVGSKGDQNYIGMFFVMDSLISFLTWIVSIRWNHFVETVQWVSAMVLMSTKELNV